MARTRVVMQPAPQRPELDKLMADALRKSANVVFSPKEMRKRVAKLEAALKYVRSLAHDEQANPTEMHMTCLSIIEKTADEALST